MKLILVRHGETKEDGKYNGSRDVALSQQGIWQAEQVGKRLEREPLSKIYTSDLSRAVETAKTINLEHEVDVQVDPDLREVNFGLWEGLTFSEISAQYPEEFRQWVEEESDFRFPQGESLAELRKRVVRGFTRIKTAHKDKTIVIVAHSGSIKVILCEVLNLDSRHFWQIKIELGSISIVEIAEENPKARRRSAWVN